MNNKEEILSMVKEAVLEVAPQAEIVLYGSRSRGDYREESDWDFLILTESEATEEFKKKIRSVLFNVGLENNQVISSIIESKNEWRKLKLTSLYKNIQDEGVTV
jgi:predicted nucleotidyltransferase